MKHFLFRDEHTIHVVDFPTRPCRDVESLLSRGERWTMTRWKMFQPPMPWIYDLRGMVVWRFWDDERGKQVEVEDILCREEGIHYGVFLKITAVGSVFTLKSVWPIVVGDFSRKFDTSDFLPWLFLKSSRSWFRISLHVNLYLFGEHIHVGLNIFQTGGSIITESWFNFMKSLMHFSHYGGFQIFLGGEIPTLGEMIPIWLD